MVSGWLCGVPLDKSTIAIQLVDGIVTCAERSAPQPMPYEALGQ
jgi:hypothetical protein